MLEPDLRILQANERTLLAWVRTGLTLMAFGFVVARLAMWLRLEYPDRGEPAASSWLGIAAIATGVACHVIGAVRFMRARQAIIAGRAMVPGGLGPVLVAGVVAAIGLAAMVHLVTSS